MRKHNRGAASGRNAPAANCAPRPSCVEPRGRPRTTPLVACARLARAFAARRVSSPSKCSKQPGIAMLSRGSRWPRSWVFPSLGAHRGALSTPVITKCARPACMGATAQCHRRLRLPSRRGLHRRRIHQCQVSGNVSRISGPGGAVYTPTRLDQRALRAIVSRCESRARRGSAWKAVLATPEEQAKARLS